MFKNLNDKKLMNNEDNLIINKFNTNNPFTYNLKDKNDKKQNLKEFNMNIDNNNIIDQEENIENDFLNDSLEKDDIINNNREDIINNEENLDELYTSIISNKRKSIIERNNSLNKKLTIGSNNTNHHKISNLNSCLSTQTQTKRKKFLREKENISPKYISEFKYDPLIDTNETNIVNKINKNITFFKNWLTSINLPFYYEKFINNDIYEINQLINISKTKTRQEIFTYLNSILKTKKIGHIYRILIKIDIDTGFIDNTFSSFLTPKKFPKNSSNNNPNNNNDNELLISGIKNVFCSNKMEERTFIKSFLEKYNLQRLYSNFINNGFDILEFVVLQMLSRFPINDYILEKDLNINDINDRKNILTILNNEVEKIYKFMKSEEYLSYTINRRAKYEDFFSHYDKNGDFYVFNDEDKCNFCILF